MKNNKTGIYFGVVIICVFLSGCTGSYGTIHFNQDLLEAYENRLPLDDYDYYYRGRPHLPYAVIGIDKTYTFDDRFWVKIDARKDVYDKISRLFDEPFGSNTLVAADITDHRGNKIGSYFSLYNYTVVKVSPEGTGVEVYNPYNPNAGDGFGSVDLSK